MSIYSVTVNNFVTRILPPDKRLPNILALWKAICWPLQWVQEVLFVEYFEGYMPTAWSAGTYANQTRVTYQHAVYQSLKDGNTDIPTVTSSWVKLFSNNVGAWERIAYHGSRLVLEYAVNKYFGTTFVQPQTPSGVGDNRSDIYIDNHSIVDSGFYIGQTDVASSNIGQTTSSGTIGDMIQFVIAYNVMVNAPATALPAIGENALRSYIQSIMPESLTFEIQTY